MGLSWFAALFAACFKAPVFPDNSDKTRTAKAINSLNNYLFSVLGLAIIANIFFFAAKGLSAIVIAFLILLTITIRLCLTKGFVRLSAFLFVGIIWLAITAVVMISGGIQSTDILLQVSLVVISGVFLNLRWMFILATATFFADSGMTIYEELGGTLPQLMAQPPMARLMILGFALIIMIAPLRIVIDDLKRTVVRLSQSRKRYATLFDKAPVMYVVLRRGRLGLEIADCNREFAKVVKKPIETIRGLELVAFYDRHSAEALHSHDGNIYTTEDLLSPTERTLVAADGTRIETLATAALISDDEDPSIVAFSMYLNVTDRYELDRERQDLLQERETLLHELHHRTINNMQIMSSLIAMYEEEDASEGAAKKYRSMRNRIEAMSLAMRQLYDSDDLASIDLTSYTLDLVAFCAGAIPLQRRMPSFEYDLMDVRASLDIALPFGLVLMELVDNALVHAFPVPRDSDRVTIRLSRPSLNRVALIVEDNGIGFPAAFDLRRDYSIGLRNALLIAEDQLHGTLRFASNSGLHCGFEFPL